VLNGWKLTARRITDCSIGETFVSDLVSIYTLIDPRNNMIRYVGQSGNVSMRYQGFSYVTASNPAIQDWFIELKQEGLKPTVHILDTVPIADADTYEVFHIQKALSEGHLLLNRTSNPSFKRERTSELMVKATHTFPPETLRRLEQLAKREGRRVSAQLVKMLEEELDRAERKKGWK
jgi:hypothetical protein